MGGPQAEFPTRPIKFIGGVRSSFDRNGRSVKHVKLSGQKYKISNSNSNQNFLLLCVCVYEIYRSLRFLRTQPAVFFL